MQVNQMVASLSFGDAIGNAALSIQSMLRDHGWFEDLIKVFAVYQKLVDSKCRLLLAGDCRVFEKYYLSLTRLVDRLHVKNVVFTDHVSTSELVAYYSGFRDRILTGQKRALEAFASRDISGMLMRYVNQVANIS